MNIDHAIAVEMAREVLIHSDILDKKVCDVSFEAADGAEDPVVQALFTMALGRPFAWTIGDWATVLGTLDECEVTIREWLQR